MAALPQPTNKTAETADAGRTCPYCRFTFKPGVDLVVCGVCSAHHHQDCWADNGGCAMMGCAASPVATQPVIPAPTPATAKVVTPPAGPPPAPPAPAGPPARGRRPLTLALLGTVAVAGIVVATLAASGALSSQPTTTTGPQPPPPPPAGPSPPPPPPRAPKESSIRATVVGTCGYPAGSGDCVLSLRGGPSSSFAEERVLHNGDKVEVVCQRRGENVYSTVRGASSRVWARTEDGLYGANVYLRGEGLNAFEVTRPC